MREDLPLNFKLRRYIWTLSMQVLIGSFEAMQISCEPFNKYKVYLISK